MTSLATLGDKAKIWEVPTFKLVEQFNPYNDSISDLTWSHDGHSIACCSGSDTSVHLRNTKDVLSAPSRSFQLQTQRSPVSAVRWNWNNNCIAAGTKQGEIILYNIVTSQASSPLVGRSTQAMLVATSDDGAVNLWDTNTRRLIRNFDHTHLASAKDVAFSPINDIFMVTVGLDKRAIFYNLESKTSIQTIVAEHPLTCVDVLQDGTTVAVGTMHGQVFLYDMRKSSTPVFNFTAHRSSVKRLSFVRKEPRKGDSTAFSSTHSTSDSLRRQLPMSPADSNVYNGSSGENLQAWIMRSPAWCRSCSRLRLPSQLEISASLFWK
ncbi:protein NEDD1-like [Elysia marginata]|uniref:Protein NEDD1-like n=1 Tax=Elysia marginata TaxID=1093978 RepID=A0AAV4EBT5_9GAST|nr:protein NEDD1-like [Elysia marginata]